MSRATEGGKDEAGIWRSGELAIGARSERGTEAVVTARKRRATSIDGLCGLFSRRHDAYRSGVRHGQWVLESLPPKVTKACS